MKLLITITMIVIFLLPIDAHSRYKSPVIVELFTSQGCPFCPPAEQVFNNIARQNGNALAVSHHVNSWNNQGWEDPHSNDYSTKIQHSYFKSGVTKKIYTPQLIINGKIEAPSTKERVINKIIRRQSIENQELFASVTKINNEKILLSITRNNNASYNNDKHSAHKYEIIMMNVQSETKDKVKAGPNAGKQLINFNVVKNIKKLDTWNGKNTSITIKPTQEKNIDLLVFVVRKQQDREIVAATAYSLK